MPSIDQLKQIADSSSVDSEGFISEFGQTQEKVLKNFNVGVARLFGLPRLATDLLEAGENKLLGLVGIEGKKTEGGLPTSEQIQEFGSKHGLTFAPGEEPQDTASRIVQNIGTTAPLLPLLGPAALIPELAAATSGAVGGKVLESTEFGQKHPVLSRAIGELGGGISPGIARGLLNFYAKGGVVRLGIKTGKKGVRKGLKGVRKGLKALPSAETRATGRLRSATPSPERAISNIVREAGSPEGKFLTPAQASGDIGLARLSQAVQEEVPEVAQRLATRRIRQLKFLERRFKGSGNIADAREFIEADLTKRANLANIALSKVSTSKDPAALSESATKIIKNGLKKARAIESEAWNKLPSGEVSSGKNLMRVMNTELRNITEGGTINEVSSFARQKLGTLKSVIKGGKKTGQVRLGGGELFNKKKKSASAKAIHQFYSQLGRERNELARQGGTSNKIRIIDDLREAALRDLDEAGLSSQYTEAIELSRDLNLKFQKGAVGKITGLGRGEAINPIDALDELIGKGSKKGREAIEQALSGAPEIKSNIEDFIRTQFVIAATPEGSNVINVNAGNKFLKNFDPVLSDVFPELKAQLQDAIRKQSGVDELVGVPQLSQLSSAVKEKAAAGIFLKANPNEEMATIINSTSIQRIKTLRDLVKLAKQDNTGKALKGLQTGFAEEIFEHARGVKKGIEFVNGRIMLSKINKLKPELIKSGMFTPEDIKRFQQVSDAFEKIAFELNAVAAKGGIISDIPSRILSTGLRVLGLRSISKLKRVVGGGGGGFGTSLQEANIISKEMSRLANRLTNDEARGLLIKAVTDRELMTDLLKNISKIPAPEGQRLIARITDKFRNITASGILAGAKDTLKAAAKDTLKAAGKRADIKLRAGAVVPPVTSLEEALGEDDKRASLIEKLSRLKAISSQ